MNRKYCGKGLNVQSLELRLVAATGLSERHTRFVFKVVYSPKRR